MEQENVHHVPTPVSKYKAKFQGSEFSPVLFLSLALYFTGSVVLYSTGHVYGGTVLLAAWVRIAMITGI